MSRAESFKKRKRLNSAPSGAVSDIHTHTHTFSIGAITGQTIAEAPIITYVERPSQDNRRHYCQELAIEPGSPVKRHRAGVAQQQPSSAPEVPEVPAAPADHEQFDPGHYEMGLDSEDDAPRAPRPKLPRVVKPSDPVLHRFRGLRDAYLASLLCRDGRMRYDTEICSLCGDQAELAQFRCKDCFGDNVICGGCMAERHLENPLHRIERWNTTFFEPATLKDLGLRVQLGHPPRERCPEPKQLHQSFVVLHTNGIHGVAVDVCDCPHRLDAGNDEEQLLRAGWFPATDDRPRTCATLAVLDLFLLSTHQAKTTMYDFYAMLEKLTHNAGVKPPNRYRVWLRMCREYRHLLMLKRAGRGHAVTGVGGTQKGELAVLCPCCPDPAVNLPPDWKDAPPEKRFLYILFLALDACFRLKRRLVSSELKDPSLGAGWGYVVENAAYRQHLLTVTDQKEMSTCSGLAALDYANTKFSRGYSATGVGMGVCARHEFVQPNGVGDLQKGERYANMDWIFACILRHKDPRLRKIISYDIVCQWWVNLKKRLKKLPPLLCFSLNLVPGSAQTDGEGIERPWAHIGGVATSTWEMGPGSREDVLNCHWNFWNWQKLIGLGERLRTRQDRAKEEYAAQLEAFTEFSIQQAERVPAWREMVEKFEKDPTAKNPYAGTVGGITEAQVLLQLEEEESKRVESGVPGIHTVSPSSFIAAGLEVEDQQRRVRIQVELKKAGTTAQQIDVVALRRKLNVSLWRLRTLQATYTPTAIVTLGQRQNVPKDEPPEKTPLFLPSALTAQQREMEPVKGLAVIEDLLRDAQCSTAIVRLRSQLHVKSRLLTYKRIQARHQGANTRLRTIVTRNETKIRLHSEKFQMAWEAKRRLVNGDPSKVGWRMLRKEDIRCMEDPEELLRNADKRKNQQERRERREDALRAEGLLAPLTAEESGERAARGGENVREVSWIWTAAGTGGTDADLEEALRIEWSKSYARTRRWSEEVGLVGEEARRLPISLEFRAKEWEDRVRAIPLGVVVPDLAEGAIAYAMKQAAMYRDIAARAEVSMSEVRRGRGKRRQWVVEEDELMLAAEGGDEGGEDDGMGLDDDEEELNDLRGGVSDEELMFGEGEDED
ncbi:hypothetical protein B0H13DRAFT_2304071 [Mycena leptocephala]|nr:hypothetical protein B0H13DRAFT_2304071 [Mycena leptocephala]